MFYGLYHEFHRLLQFGFVFEVSSSEYLFRKYCTISPEHKINEDWLVASVKDHYTRCCQVLKQCFAPGVRVQASPNGESSHHTSVVEEAISRGNNLLTQPPLMVNGVPMSDMDNMPKQPPPAS